MWEEQGGGAFDTRHRLGDGDTGRGRAGGAEKNGGSVPLTRVGRSRIESVNLSTALGIDALGGGGGETLGRQQTGGGSRGRNHGAYRGPGAAAGSEWAPGGRPPRAFVPFLNLPAFDAKGGTGSGRRRRRQGENNTDRADGVDSLPIPSYVGVGVGDPPSRIQRGRPLIGVGGVPISPGRAMLTGPGRPGTGTSEVSSRMFEDTEREDGRGRRRRKHGGDGDDGGGGGRGGFRHQNNDGGLSDGGDSIASGSTDVEFLRRRAEAKLRSLQRQEEVSEEAAPGIVRFFC